MNLVSSTKFVVASLFLFTATVSAQDIPINFTLDRPGYVTIVIDDEDGVRTHNLIQNEHFSAGTHTVYWDGKDFGERANVGSMGEYDIERRAIEAGRFRARAIIHDGIQKRYRMSVQSPGSPPWRTDDNSNTGGWLADHQPAWDIQWISQDAHRQFREDVLFVGSYIFETGFGIAWLDQNGQKFRSRGGTVERNGANFVAVDGSPNRSLDYTNYIAAVWTAPRQMEIRLWAYTAFSRDQIVHYRIDRVPDLENPVEYLTGFAAHNDVLVVASWAANTIDFVDAQTGEVFSSVNVNNPRGLLVQPDTGRLLVGQGQRILEFDVDWTRGRLTNQRIFNNSNVEDVRNFALGPDGSVYVSDWGNAHQVKVFRPNGSLRSVIGTAGIPSLGRYDESKMHMPMGMTVDSEGKLWVAEIDFIPKRMSVWDANSGSFLKALYGPPKYGGGGALDPHDRTRFYYNTGARRDNNAGIEFRLDWANRSARPQTIYWRKPANVRFYPDAEFDEPYGNAPEYAHYVDGRQYLVNDKNDYWGAGGQAVSIWLMQNNEKIRPVASLGQLYAGPNPERANWPLLEENPQLNSFFQSQNFEDPRRVYYIWTDNNSDGRVSADELQFVELDRDLGRFHVSDGLVVSESRGRVIEPRRFDGNGVPRYHVSDIRMVVEPEEYSLIRADGGGEVVNQDDWFVVTGGPIAGYSKSTGEMVWRYHSQWPNRLSSQSAPVSQYSGQIISQARLIGPTVQLPNNMGHAFFLNDDKGMIHVITTDGFYLTTLGGDDRLKTVYWPINWDHDMLIENVSFHNEHFWPSVTQMTDGTVYLVSGKEHTSILELEGFNTIRRVDLGDIVIGEGPVLPPGGPEPGAVVHRINAGAQREFSKLDKIFSPDKFFSGGFGEPRSPIGNILDTDLNMIYRWGRSSAAGATFSYNLPVAPGLYSVRLHFAELFFGAQGGPNQGIGQRVFNVSIQGQRVLENLDIFAEVGAEAALMKSFDGINVTGNTLSISFESVQGPARIAAIEVFSGSTIASLSGGTEAIADGLLAETTHTLDASVDGASVNLSWVVDSPGRFEAFRVEQARQRCEQAACTVLFEPVATLNDGLPNGSGGEYMYRLADVAPGTYKYRVVGVTDHGLELSSQEVEVEVTLAEDYQLSAGYPNPFNAQTRFTLAVREEQNVTIEVFDMLGRRVATVFDDRLHANEVRYLSFDASNLPSGVYLIQASGDTFNSIRRVTLAK